MAMVPAAMILVSLSEAAPEEAWMKTSMIQTDLSDWSIHVSRRSDIHDKRAKEDA